MMDSDLRERLAQLTLWDERRLLRRYDSAQRARDDGKRSRALAAFDAHAGEDTAIRLMTDGILLAEIQSDRELWRYDTLIIDEAHERSLNIDYLLAYVKQLLPRRPDLKVIITSATIDPQRFSRHFDDAPIVEVSGRTYPVEVRYRPIVDPDDPEGDPDRDHTQGILDAVAELGAESPGDILL